MYWVKKEKQKQKIKIQIKPYTTMTLVQLIDLFIGQICGKW